MTFLQLIILAISLSMDAFAVAICKGLEMKKLCLKRAVLIAVFFGVFQGIMPLLGYFLGRGFQVYIESIDHWIAFILLAAIGGKMIHEALTGKDAEAKAKAEGEKCPETKVEREKCPGTEFEAKKCPETDLVKDQNQLCPLNIRETFTLAVATSIDALVVGIALGLLPGVNIYMSAIAIGLITFIISLIGIIIGKSFGEKIKSKAEILGGLTLILIGLKILLEHLGVLG